MGVKTFGNFSELEAVLKLEFGIFIGSALRISYRTLGKGGFPPTLPPPLTSVSPPQESWSRKLIV